MAVSLPGALPEDYSTGMAGHVEAHEAANKAINILIAAVRELQGLVDALGGPNGYSDSDAVSAVLAALQGGNHYGLTVTGGVNETINAAVTYPTLPLAAGAAVPAGTPANTQIVRVG